MTYEELLIEADKLGVIVKEANLRTVDGKCYGNRIAINASLSECEKICTLKEELLHYQFTVGNITDQNKIENRKQELFARKYCYEKLAHPDDIIKALLAGIDNLNDLAEHLNVTTDFLTQAIEHHKKSNGVYYTGDTHVLVFKPSLHVLHIEQFMF